MFVERLILEKGTAVEHCTYLVWLLRMLAIKMLEVTDLSRIVPQFLGWEDSGMILVEDLPQELSVMPCFSGASFLCQVAFSCLAQG